MCQESEQVLHGEIGYGRPPTGAKLTNWLFSKRKVDFATHTLSGRSKLGLVPVYELA